MDDSLLMRLVHRGADLLEDVYDPFERETLLFLQHVGECATIEVFHYQVCDGFAASSGKTKVGYIHNIGMAQSTSSTCLPLEALDKLDVAHELRHDQFERDVTFGTQMSGKIHRAHTAATQESLEAIFLIKHLAYVMLKSLHFRQCYMVSRDFVNGTTHHAFVLLRDLEKVQDTRMLNA